MNKYLIIPSCSDYNRGDQALVFESVRLAQDAGFKGDYYMLAGTEPTHQIQQEGIKVIAPVLEHPSRKYKNKDNLKYGKILKIKWGAVALFDLIGSLYILTATVLKFLPLSLSYQKKKTLKIYQDADAVFVKGGGFLHAYGGLTSGYFIYFNIYHMLLAIVNKKPLYIFPNSMGPLDGFMVRPMTRYIFKNSKVIMCRESISNSFIKEQFNVDSKLFPDLAFYLEKDYSINVCDYFSEKNIPIKSKKCVAITVRPYRFPGIDNGEELYSKYINSIVVFAQYLISKDFFPVFVQHTLAENMHEDDTKSIKEIIFHLQEGKYGKIYDVNLNCRQLKTLYGEFYCIVGTRFHSVIFSLSSAVPAIALAYGGNKSQGIMRDIGLSDYVIPMEDITTNMLISKFELLINNYAETKGKIEKVMDSISSFRTALIEIVKKKDIHNENQ